VDDMNRERIEIIQAMNLLVRQEMIKDQMEKCRDALAS